MAKGYSRFDNLFIIIVYKYQIYSYLAPRNKQKNKKLKHMKTINNSKLLIYSDANYMHSVNPSRLYNNPITLNYGAKHERTKYILPCGNQDIIEMLQDGVFIYVVSQNNGLNYISLTLINTESKQIEGEVFLNEEDCSNEENFSFGILDLQTDEQIKILTQYLN